MTNSNSDNNPSAAGNPASDIAQLSPFEQAESAVRFLSVDAVEAANSGHPGAPMGLATVATEIFAHHLRYNPDQPKWPNRDRFVLSCGHASALLYSLLHLAGYGLQLDELKAFRSWGARTAGHPEYGHIPGIEITTGPLGQGLSSAVGMALASKMASARLSEANAELLSHNVYVIASDGDVMEGVAAEACSLAGHLCLDNLIVIYDANNVTIDGAADLSMTEDVAARFRAAGWGVQHADGHDQAALAAALGQAKLCAQPALIVARTHIGFGSVNKQDTSACHGSPLGPDDVRATKEAFGWPQEPAFFVPDGAREVFAAATARNALLHQEWAKKVAALDTEQAAIFQQIVAPQVPSDLLEQLVAVAGEGADATRSHGGRIQQRLAELVPALAGGSADLSASTKTRIKSSGDVAAGDFSGRNLNFGIREHAMGAIMNGLALSNMFLPFGSTFLIFSDYMRAPMRLAALMKQRCVYVFTHDSILLGEDGPTHQPVEQLWSLRMVPNLDVFRPADAVECAAAWAYAASRTDGPTAISLTRHKVPHLPKLPSFEPSQVLQGAYVVADAEDLDLVLIATGSEVSVALAARELLAAAGKKVRVVSMPCVEAFQRLSAEKQNAVLPPGIRRASFELGVTAPWKFLTGLSGIEIGIDTFGSSAPHQVLQEELGVSAQLVAETIKSQLG